MSSKGEGARKSGISALSPSVDKKGQRQGELTSDFLTFEDRSGFLAWHGRLVQRLVAVRVKLFSGRVERDDSVPRETLFNLSLGQRDALVQPLEVGVGRQLFGLDRLDREVENVDRLDEVFRERLQREVLRLGLFARRDLLQVFEIGQGPQSRVFEFGNLFRLLVEFRFEFGRLLLVGGIGSSG